MTDLSGKTIKGCILHRKVAEGGFGAVYYAFQPLGSYNGREVAIKVILPQFATIPNFTRRFEAEAQIIARLEHPHIVPLYEYWRDSSGAYLVMRWMPGGSLAEKLRQGSLALDAVVRMLDQIADALTFAHAHGVIHRDLKPNNILLDADGRAYLADFGIAVSQAMVVGTPLSEARACTPGYAAPEQILFAPASPQSDIYSMGVLLYELLTGLPAFQGATPGEIVQQQLHKGPPRVCDSHPDLPAKLDEIIQHATARDPHERYTNAMQLATDVRGVLASASTPHHADSRQTIVFPLSGLLKPYNRSFRIILFGLVMIVLLLSTQIILNRSHTPINDGALLAPAPTNTLMPVTSTPVPPITPVPVTSTPVPPITPVPVTSTPVPASTTTSPSSHFDSTNTEGWSVSLGGVTNPGSGGNGGGPDNGFLSWIERDTDNFTSYYVAPSSYHRDWSRYSTLQLNLQSSGGTSGRAVPHGDIYLKNGKMTAQYSLPHRPASTWEFFSIPLTNSSQWVLDGGATHLEDVLKNVTDFEIRAEYGAGNDSSGLDNIALIR